MGSSCSHIAKIASNTHRLHAVSHEPMEAFDEQEEAKHNDERNVKVVPKDGKRQQRFGDEHPCLIIETLKERLLS